MGWRLTPRERRIIERTRRGGNSDLPADSEPFPRERGTAPPTGGQVPLWRSILAWIGGILLFVLLALLMVWVGTLL